MLRPLVLDRGLDDPTGRGRRFVHPVPSSPRGGTGCGLTADCMRTDGGLHAYWMDKMEDWMRTVVGLDADWMRSIQSHPVLPTLLWEMLCELFVARFYQVLLMGGSSVHTYFRLFLR